MELRPYQQDAIAAIYQFYRAGTTRQCLVLATGLGKTVVFAKLVQAVNHQALVLVHRNELVDQTIEKLELFGIPRDDIGIVKAGKSEQDRPCVIASQQTLQRSTRLLKLLEGPTRRLIVCDEAHHILPPGKRHPEGNSWYRIIQDCAARWPKALLLGCTATPFRPNNSPIIGAPPLPFSDVPYTMSIAEGVYGGFLSGIEGRMVTLEGLNLDGLKRSQGDWTEASIEAELQRIDALPMILAGWKRHAAGKRTLAYFPTVALAGEFAALCQQHDISADCITGATPMDVRREIYASFRNGSTRVIANCMVLTEGFDEPATECIVIARPTTSRVLYQQTVGRGLRPYPGKDACLILDCTGATERHNLMSVAHITGLVDIDEDADEGGDEDTPDVDPTKPKGPARDPAKLKITLGRHEHISLHRKSPMRWVTTVEGRHVLQFFDGMIRLVPSDTVGRELWKVEWLPRDGQPKQLVSHVPLDYAMGAAEDTARDRSRQLIKRGAAWLKQPNDSEKQHAFARRLGLEPREYSTRGEMSDAITAIVGDW